MITPVHIRDTPSLSPPFGTYALPSAREAWRLRAAKASSGKIGRWSISFCRKRALAGLEPPFDVTIEPVLKARLYPHGNRCEKRAIAGIHIWDAPERAFLKTAISKTDRPFTFLDVGANIGLYSLYAAHYAQQTGRDINIHAIEPDIKNRQRLIDNINANGFKITLWPTAVSNAPGTLFLQPHPDNRGEIKLSTSKTEQTVSVTTLTDIITRTAAPHIDLMKLDIEGHDLRALEHLFENLNPSLYPKRLIIETGTADDVKLTSLCYNQGYVVKGQGRLNLMLERDE